ncbi:hypothetical protein M514_03409 [Trichuris suis]|uniref:Uncharacterized protein n=1 Tax=Trichuris suis TaxID=68888 RepID=A0A085NF27_9BILA|nr:hypothetical protein M513_03409 [Trichuris suis]KFD68073.1 hypothetical protein M514_03409 [Trichuris suis]
MYFNKRKFILEVHGFEVLKDAVWEWSREMSIFHLLAEPGGLLAKKDSIRKEAFIKKCARPRRSRGKSSG